MDRRQLVFAAAFTAPLLIGPVGANAADKIKVASSFSVLGDMVKQVGGDRVDVTTFVGPNGDAHVYEPTPGDAKTLLDSKILVVNGLGLEGWMSRLQKSSGFKGQVVTATKGIKTRQMEEEEKGKTRKITDPHAWQSLVNGRVYVQNIRDGLVGPIRPARKPTRPTLPVPGGDRRGREDREGQHARLPPARRKIITTHDARHFGATYGCPSPGRREYGKRGSAGDVQDHSPDWPRRSRRLPRERHRSPAADQIARRARSAARFIRMPFANGPAATSSTCSATISRR